MGSEYEIEKDGTIWQNVVAGMLIGLVVGGAVALLLAPKSGSELRADLATSVDDLKDKAEVFIDDLQETAAEFVKQSRQVVEQTRENLVRSVEAGKEAYVSTKEELTAQLETH